MEKKNPALNVLAENAFKENKNKAKGYATFGSFRWHVPDDELNCSVRLLEVLEVGEKRTLSRWAHLIECICPDDVPIFEDAIAGIMSGHNIVNTHFRIVAPSGMKSLVLLADVYRDTHGIPVYLDGVIRFGNLSASTEQTQYVTRLLMDTVHSVNNKFTAILGSTAMAVSSMGDRSSHPELFEYFEEIEHEVFRSAELLRHLVQAAKRL